MQRRMACSFSTLKTTLAAVIQNKNTERQAVSLQTSYVAVSTVRVVMGLGGLGGVRWEPVGSRLVQSSLVLVVADRQAAYADSQEPSSLMFR
jgi:hypothetical protein